MSNRTGKGKEDCDKCHIINLSAQRKLATEGVWATTQERKMQSTQWEAYGGQMEGEGIKRGYKEGQILEMKYTLREKRHRVFHTALNNLACNHVCIKLLYICLCLKAKNRINCLESHLAQFGLEGFRNMILSILGACTYVSEQLQTLKFT